MCAMCVSCVCHVCVTCVYILLALAVLRRASADLSWCILWTPQMPLRARGLGGLSWQTLQPLRVAALGRAESGHKVLAAADPNPDPDPNRDPNPDPDPDP